MLAEVHRCRHHGCLHPFGNLDPVPYSIYNIILYKYHVYIFHEYDKKM